MEISSLVNCKGRSFFCVQNETNRLPLDLSVLNFTTGAILDQTTYHNNFEALSNMFPVVK
jgi:hypothetical protein